ncbi:glutamate carboxypeptidase [Synergistales bacterium]|nr:glutamate carboxypeptidase [Synergistales bacterium]
MSDSNKLSAIREKASFYAPLQLDMLNSLTSIDSGTGNLEGNKKTVKIIAESLRSYGALVECIESPGVGIHIVARVGAKDAGRKIIVSAHLDTVFAPGEALRHPFHIEGENAYGLGIADCKGGVVVSMFAVRIAGELGLIPDDLEITIIYNCDEETGSDSSKALFEAECKNADLVYVFEPARGENGVVTSRRGCAFGTVEVTGKSAHAGLDYLGGADANLELARRVSSLCDKNVPKRGIFFNVGSIRGGEHADIVSERAAADFFVSFADDEDMRLIQRVVKELESECGTPGCFVKTDFRISSPPMEKSEKNLKAYNTVKAAADEIGIELPEQSSIGSSDACWYSSFGVPTIDALGPYMSAVHTTDESLKIKTIQEKTELFALAISKL